MTPENSKPVDIQGALPPQDQIYDVVRPLPERFKRNGLHYRQIRRQGMVAMFELLGSEIGPVMGYEVFIVQSRPASIIMGKTIPARETDPGNEQFGMQGWSWINKNMAEKCYAEMLKNIEEEKNDTANVRPAENQI